MTIIIIIIITITTIIFRFAFNIIIIFTTTPTTGSNESVGRTDFRRIVYFCFRARLLVLTLKRSPQLQ